MAPRLHTALLLGLALAACSKEELADPLPPLDRFYYPTAVATTHVNGTTAPTLLVVSSNFDLRYSASNGGTLLALHVDTTVAPGPVAPAGAERISSYAGPLAVADARSCAGLSSLAGAQPTAAVFVASRYSGVLYRYALGPDGALSCGPGCEHAFDAAVRDPFDVAIACGAAGNKAYVGFLRTPLSTRGSGDGAWVAELDLETSNLRLVEVGDGTVRSLAYEPPANRLWLAARPTGERAYLYSVDLSDPTWTLSPWDAMDVVDLFPAVRGAELRAIAVGTPPVAAGDPRRLYLTARLYDVEAQTAAGGVRPAGDVGGVLLVLDVTDGIDGRPVVTVRRIVPIGTSIGEVAVVSRAPVPGATVRDVVLVTALDGDLLYVYDDEAEAVAQVIAKLPDTTPLLGNRPMALAVDQPIQGAAATVFVGAFGSHLVKRFVLDPANPAAPVVTATKPADVIGGLGP